MDIQDVLDNYRIFLDNETPYAEKTKQKYFNITRAFLNEMLNKYKKLSFTIEDLNEHITKKTRGSRRGDNVKHGLKNFLISIGKTTLAAKLKRVKHKPRKKQFPYFEPSVMNKIVNLLNSPYKKIAWIQAHTGARFREAATIKIQDISSPDSGNLIYITVSEYTKGSKRRTIYLRKEHFPLLQTIIKDRNFGFLVLHNKCNTYTDDQINKELDTLLAYYNRELNKVGKDLDIPRLSSHYVRHHFADTFILRGGRLEILQRILGHAKIETTQEYISVTDALTTQQLSEMDEAM